MNARRGLIVVIAALVAILAWLLWPRGEPRVRALTLSRPAAGYPGAHTTVPAVPDDKTERPPSAEARSELADQLNLPGTTLQSDLRVVQGIVDAYRSNFHENPVGTNAEITGALMGRNRLLLALVPRDHSAVNLKGELCDRWGRPFFFHQLSSIRMEIRSGGPDRKMWTDDDVVLTP